MRLSASTHELGGVDVVYRRLNFQLAALSRHMTPSVTSKKLGEYAFDIGRPNYMLQLARLFLDWFMRRNGSHRCCWHIREYLNSLINHITGAQRQAISRNVAVAMALHARLGRDAMLGMLGSDIMPMCIAESKPSVITWRDVMGRWIDE